jgi:hypothetical protein
MGWSGAWRWAVCERTGGEREMGRGRAGGGRAGEVGAGAGLGAWARGRWARAEEGTGHGPDWAVSSGSAWEWAERDEREGWADLG